MRGSPLSGIFGRHQGDVGMVAAVAGDHVWLGEAVVGYCEGCGCGSGHGLSGGEPQYVIFSIARP